MKNGIITTGVYVTLFTIQGLISIIDVYLHLISCTCLDTTTTPPTTIKRTLQPWMSKYPKDINITEKMSRVNFFCLNLLFKLVVFRRKEKIEPPFIIYIILYFVFAICYLWYDIKLILNWNLNYLTLCI